MRTFAWCLFKLVNVLRESVFTIFYAMFMQRHFYFALIIKNSVCLNAEEFQRQRKQKWIVLHLCIDWSRNKFLLGKLIKLVYCELYVFDHIISMAVTCIELNYSEPLIDKYFSNDIQINNVTHFGRGNQWDSHTLLYSSDWFLQQELSHLELYQYRNKNKHAVLWIMSHRCTTVNCPHIRFDWY